jgi:hypothetical protein
MRMPQMSDKHGQKIYSINEGYAKYWDRATTEYVHEKKFPQVITVTIDLKQNIVYRLSHLFQGQQ